ncbi:MAG: P-II family nitrogen regulator [Candidatus Rokuibacteriota bacterium]
MKEIKAYIRRDQVNQVVERLCAAGAPGVSIIEIHPLGYGYESNPFAPHAAKFIDRYSYLTIVKLEIMCIDAQLESLVQVIQEQCRTRSPGGGMIFVSEIVDAIRIKDGLRGESALGAGRSQTSGVAPRVSAPA